MKKLLLANIDYESHMTNEGDLLQRGLARCGWILSGVGFDNCTNAKSAVLRYKPDVVLVHDPRDWDPRSRISFRKDIGFDDVDWLREQPIPKAVVVKDAATMVDYQDNWARRIGAQAAIVYYHPVSVSTHARWLNRMELIRTYHSIDPADLPASLEELWRDRWHEAVLTGAVGERSYPLRARLAAHRGPWVRQRHPGYHNHGCVVPAYYEMLRKYKVHVATASRYGFMLRKIIESVAMGCTPVTNLPTFDAVPSVDRALIRIEDNWPIEAIEDVVRSSVESWDPARAWDLSRIALQRFHFEHTAQMLDADIRDWAAHRWVHDPESIPDPVIPKKMIRRGKSGEVSR